MLNLGVMLAETRRQEEAETWYRKAAAAGVDAAMNNLGNLPTETGRREEAQTWYQKAATIGNAHAMYGLGLFLLEETSQQEEAASWCRKAAAAGETNAMFSLAVLLAVTGRQEEAEGSYRQAAAGPARSLRWPTSACCSRGPGVWKRLRSGSGRRPVPGDAAAMGPNLGNLLKATKRRREAFKWYREAAAKHLGS